MSKRSRRSTENFARIPISVLESAACKSCPHAAFKVLVLLAAQYRGANNGSLALTEFYGRKFGLTGRDTLYRSLAELRSRGLIVRTRRGIKHRRLFSLYALGWAQVDNLDGRPLAAQIAPTSVKDDDGGPCPDWRTWCAPTRPIIGNDHAEIQTDSREHTRPMIGTGEAVSVPISATKEPFCVPTIGNTSRSPPGAGAGAASAATDSAPFLAARKRSRSRSQLRVVQS
jgi:hypothetical protein